MKRLYDNLYRQLECAINRVEFRADAGELNDHFFDPDSDSDINLPSSLLHFEDEHFPIFIPIFNFLTRVDATLEIPFFAEGIGNNEENIAYHLMRRGMKIRNLYTPNGFVKVPTFLIDFDYFSHHYWPRLRSLIGISPIAIWTEISSVIKGSPEAYKDIDGHIPKETYINLGKKQSQIDSEKREKIWDIFVQYEHWKKSQNAYDFQDVVNYVLKCIDNEGYKGSPIHFTFIDEVQDCTNSFLLLILKLTEQKLLFMGDTAQSIIRGAGFRFCDLNSLFLESSVIHHSQPVIMHLSVNFRSHMEILEVAHIVVQLIVSFFPDYIDRLDKETSKIHGAKPIIVKSNSLNALKLCIQKISKRTTDIEFGWNQVVLVRTDKSRKNLPQILKDAICLTILESKGLEFDDVILYNFFNDSEVEENEWARLSKFIDNDINEIKKAREGMKNSLLCSELKHLYVGITRARKNVIIFDEDNTCRESLQKCWITYELVELFDFNIEIQNQIIEPENENTDWNNKETWRKLGLQFFSRKNYGQAKFCWHKAGDEILIKKIDATMSAEEGKKLLSEIAAMKEKAKEDRSRLSRQQIDNISAKKQNAKNLFKNAARLFGIAREFKEAAQCYSTLENYKVAAKLFLRVDMINEAALAYYKGKYYNEAADLYERSRNYAMHVKCTVFADKYDKALASLEKYILDIPENEAKLLLQLIIRCSVSCYFPEPYFIRERKSLSH